MKICYWADGTWCLDYELPEMTWKSDDTGVIEVPDENAYEDWQIDMMVRERCEGGT